MTLYRVDEQTHSGFTTLWFDDDWAGACELEAALLAAKGGVGAVAWEWVGVA